jgi:hypothetical protein
MPLYRQCAISLDRPRFQLFGSLHFVVDGRSSDLLRDAAGMQCADGCNRDEFRDYGEGVV